MAISRFVYPMNMPTQDTLQRPYIDDIFDPLFNKQVTDYYKSLYGPIGGIAAGYGAMFENALTGRKGILGPGMGILSTFGRSMDKADDFILGGITEGVNAVGQLTGGTNQTPQDPIKHIFVDDYNYEGTKLMAAMGNAMAKLAGTQTPLTEEDFNTFGDKAAGVVIDLATDPGIAGGQLARLNGSTPVGKVGQMLSNYDDAMANIAGNMAFPGGKALIGKTLHQIRDLLPVSSSAKLMDNTINWDTPEYIDLSKFNFTTDTGLSPENVYKLGDFTEDIVQKYNLTPMDEEWSIVEDIRDRTGKAPTEIIYDGTERIPTPDELATPAEIAAYKAYQEQRDAYLKHQAELTALRNEIDTENASYIQNIQDDINRVVENERIIPATMSTEEGYEIPDSAKLLEDDPEAYYEQYKYYDPDKYSLEERTLADIHTTKHNKHFVITKARNYEVAAPQKLKYIYATLQDIKKTDPNLFDNTYLKSIMPELEYTPNSVLNNLMSGYATNMYTKGHKFANVSEYNKLMAQIQDNFIPWVDKNYDILSKSKAGKKLIDLADDWNNVLFKMPYNGERLPVSELFQPSLEGLNSVFDDTQIKTFEDYLRLRKEYPTLDLFLNEGSDASYLFTHKFTKEELAKQFPDLSENELSAIIDAQEQIPLTSMKDVWDRIPKDTLPSKYIKAPRYAELKKAFPEAVLEPVDPFAEDLISKPMDDTITYLAESSPEEFTYRITKPTTTQLTQASEAYNDIFKDFKTSWNLPDDLPPDDLEWFVKQYGSRDDKTFLALYNSAVEDKIRIRMKQKSGVEGMQRFKELKIQADNLFMKYHGTDTVRDYLIKKSKAEDMIIKSDEMLPYLLGSGGQVGIKVHTHKNNIKLLRELHNTLSHNVAEVNKYGPILELVEKHLDDGSVYMGYRFNTKNINIKQNLSKIYSLFGNKKLDLKDMVFQVADPSIDLSKYTDLEEFFGQNGIQGLSEDLATRLGFKRFRQNYVKFAMEDTEEAGQFWDGFHKQLIDNPDALEEHEKALDNIVGALRDFDIAERGQFGSLMFNRANLGSFDEYLKGYTTDIRKIHSSTFTKGMLDDVNAQTYFDLFLTDNFKINKQFKDVDTLKKTLFMTDETGNIAGNLDNISIVKPRYNADGKLIGFTRYNKFSDLDLQKAFQDNEAVLLPNSVIGSLDRLAKKDLRMSSRVYRFINKYLTVPFKFGTLANPGFIAGNIQDAYFKQAVELSKKYGTTLEEELANVAMSMRYVTTVNNQFSDIFDNYRQWLRNTDMKNLIVTNKPGTWAKDTFSKSQRLVEELTPERVMSNPELYKAWREYYKYYLPADKQRLAKFYTFLNSNQTTTMFKNNNLDLEDVKDLLNENPYNTPNNLVERMMYGNPNAKGLNSWGLFLNNPVSNKIINTSNTIENWMRSATILNDLNHQGYSMEQIMDILQLDKTAEKATWTKLRASMNEAINTMHAANFDYDNVQGIVAKAAYILPFPTFYLKNLGFWADIFTNKPQIIDNIISVHEGLWSGNDTSDEFVAEAKGRGAIPIPGNHKHLTGIVKQTPYNSMFGAFNAVNNFKEDVAYRINPIARPVTRHLQDPADIKYRPYNTNQYQRNIKKGDPDFSELAYLFHQLNPYERFINTGLRTPGKVENNTYQLSDFLPSMVQPNYSKKSK